MDKTYGMPNEQQCRELGLPHQLLCRRGHVLSSKIGVTEDEFDGAFSSAIAHTMIGQRRRYYTAAVIHAFLGVRVD